MGVARQLDELTGDQIAIDGAADWVQGALRGMFVAGGATGKYIKNLLHGTWLGHPLHPALVRLPIGAWSLAVTLDTIGARGAPPALGMAADAAVGFGTLTAVAAAAAGVTDWGDIDGSVICPWHASRFALESGRVLDGPATFPVPCFATRVRDGQIEVRAAHR